MTTPYREAATDSLCAHSRYQVEGPCRRPFCRALARIHICVHRQVSCVLCGMVIPWDQLVEMSAEEYQRLLVEQ